jgi:transcriptional regulator with XRE-family HTH domain
VPSARPATIQQAFGDAVRSIRLERALSQEGLAELAGLHRTYVGDVERGERNVSLVNIERLALALGVRPSEVLARTEKRRSH